MKKQRKSGKKVGDNYRKPETFNLLVKAADGDAKASNDDKGDVKYAERSKIFLDDFIDCVTYAFSDVTASKEGRMKTFSSVTSIVLEFAWTSSVVLNG